MCYRRLDTFEAAAPPDIAPPSTRYLMRRRRGITVTKPEIKVRLLDVPQAFGGSLELVKLEPLILLFSSR